MPATMAAATTHPPTENMNLSRNTVSKANLSTRVVTVWRQGKAKVNRLLGNGPQPESRSTHEPTRYFPHEIVEMIIAYLIHDLGTLKTCSLTCHSWYIAAVPHLHHTLTLGEGRPRFSHNKLRPLSRLQDLGLIPLIEEIRVDQVFDTTYWFLPRAFSRRDLRIFSTFANVHTLKLQNMQIYHFISDIERYFGHFSPTLRSITLYDPCCTPRQLSHFFSLFPNLEDIEIWGVCVHLHTPGTAITDMELVSFSVPKLRGRLALCNSSWIETWKHLTASCGGLRFRHVHIHGSTYCVPFLLEALSETLETLQLSADNDAVRNLNLSGLKVLRSLQVEGWVAYLGDFRASAIVEAFSTITSPVFSEVVVVLAGCVGWFPQGVEVKLFKILRTMSEVRTFKLVFLLEDSGLHREELVGTLDSANARGLLNFLDPPPIIRTA